MATSVLIPKDQPRILDSAIRRIHCSEGSCRLVARGGVVRSLQAGQTVDAEDQASIVILTPESFAALRIDYTHAPDPSFDTDFPVAQRGRHR